MMTAQKTSEILSDLITRNDSYVTQHQHKYFETFQNSQTPEITLLTCSDSRVQLDFSIVCRFPSDISNTLT